MSIDSSLPSSKVISSLKQLIEWRGKPEKIRVDNGSEFIAQKMKDWCTRECIELQFIQPGKPTQNSLIERFNRTFRTEFLDVYLFENLKQMKNYAEVWMWKYNNERPHSALQYLTSRDFLLKYGKITLDNVEDFGYAELSFPTFHQNFDNSNSIISTE